MKHASPYHARGYGEMPVCELCSRSMLVPHADTCTWLPPTYWADDSGRFGIYVNGDPDHRIMLDHTDNGYVAARAHFEDLLFRWHGRPEREGTDDPDGFEEDRGYDKRRYLLQHKEPSGQPGHTQRMVPRR